MENNWLTPREIGDLVGCSHDTASRLLRTGKIPAINIGVGWKSRWIARKIDVERWLEARKAATEETS